MSFSSTPLGQGRRLDHHTFLNKPASSSSSSNYIARPNSPPRRQIPASYAYGASTAGTRSPPKPSSQSATAADIDDADQPALVRFARLKQRDQLHATRSAPDLVHNTTSRTNASSSQSTSSKPEKWSVKDTSVQIASAFHQAATSTPLDSSMPPTNPNDAWASGATRKTVPRSSSVEYEKETQSTVNRRLGAPAPRLNRIANRPIAKSTSLQHVPDSEAEDEPVSRAERAKSPFEHVIDVAKQFAPASFFLRSPSKEPEERSAIGANGELHNISSSYDYSAEEREYQAASQKPVSRRGTANHRRNRMSMDNKAYRPSVSEDESDDEFEEDGKRTRRKKAKKGTAGGGPLTTLPVAGYDKKKKKRRGTKTNGVDDGQEGSSEEQEEEQEQEQLRVSEQRSIRGATPLARAPSVPRASVPPPSRMSIPRTSAPPPDTSHSSDLNASMDVERALDSIPEHDEPPEVEDEHIANKSFSFGASLGRTVHWTMSSGWKLVTSVLTLFSFLTTALTRTIQFAAELFLLRPLHTLQTNSYALAKYVVLALSMYLAWRGLKSGVNPLDYLPSLPSLSSPSPNTYQPPDVPPADIVEFSTRLQRLESAIAGLSRDSQRSLHYMEGEAKSQTELGSRLSLLETLIHKESVRAKDLETKFRSSANQELQSVKHEIDVLRAQLQVEHRENESHRASTAADKEARAKLKAFEGRLDSLEGGVKEALELGKATSKAEFISENTIAWWNKLASGKDAAVALKSTDGQDVTSLINHLVDSAVTKYSKDTLARADFALHSGGARVIPALTSDTFEIRPATLLGQMVGTVTGNGYAVGRPPVTFLHHELHDGHCWPFAGSQGQIAIVLSAPVLISDITIDHVAKEVATDIRSAPRQMEVWALVEGQDNVAKVQEWQARKAAAREEAGLEPEEDTYPRTLPRSPTYIRIATFTYNIYSPKYIQTFPVDQEIKDLGVDFGVVVLLVNNNWGREEFTCLYRMRVHGQKLGELSLPYPEDFAS